MWRQEGEAAVCSSRKCRWLCAQRLMCMYTISYIIIHHQQLLIWLLKLKVGYIMEVLLNKLIRILSILLDFTIKSVNLRLRLKWRKEWLSPLLALALPTWFVCEGEILVNNISYSTLFFFAYLCTLNWSIRTTESLVHLDKLFTMSAEIVNTIGGGLLVFATLLAVANG